jgi:hypothetical protein
MLRIATSVRTGAGYAPLRSPFARKNMKLIFFCSGIAAALRLVERLLARSARAFPAQ